MKSAALAGLLLLAAGPAGAVTLKFPAKAEVTGKEVSALGSYAVPVGPWRNGTVKTVAAEGPLRITAWRIAKRDISTMNLLVALRGQIVAEGFKPIYECDTQQCGGFDFRYAMNLLPEPQMHVDLGDFRYLAARRQGPKGPEYFALMVSRSQDAGFVEAVQVGGAAPAVAQEVAAAPTPSDVPPTESDIGAVLADSGSVALDDLSFATGSSDLAAGDYPSLAALAAYLHDHPDQKITLVGHTDAKGSLDANIALSKKRALSVRDRLVKDYGVDPAQLSAQGVGYLAPRASNLTKTGREENRRVEAILDSTQ